MTLKMQNHMDNHHALHVFFAGKFVLMFEEHATQV